jgi:hypothetical protein
MAYYSKGGAPWYEYRGYITTIVVADEIDSISENAFYQCNNLQSIKLPFVGGNRSASGYSSVFGYIFGYTSVSASSSTYRYVYDGTTNSYKGGSYYTTTGSYPSEYVDYRLGTSSTAMYNPSGTTFQYSYYNASNYLTSYYYYIPSSLKKVDVTDATNLSSAAFKNCSNLTEIALNNEISSIGIHSFNYCTSLKKVNIPSSLESVKNTHFTIARHWKRLNYLIVFKALANALSTIALH